MRDREIYPDVGWQSPSGGSRPVPIGSRSIGVSLQPAIPWRVAPQQSPSPLHRSPILITHLCSGAQSNALLDLTATAQTSPRSHWTGPNIEAMPMRSAPRPRSVISTLRARCHFYLAPTEQRRAIAILDIGGVHLGADQQTAGIGHNVAFTAFDLRGRMIPTRRTTLGGLDRLTVDNPCRRAGFTTPGPVHGRVGGRWAAHSTIAVALTG